MNDVTLTSNERGCYVMDGVMYTSHGDGSETSRKATDEEVLLADALLRATDELRFQTNETAVACQQYRELLAENTKLKRANAELLKRNVIASSAHEPCALRFAAEKVRDHACAYGAPADSLLVKRELIFQLAEALGGSITDRPAPPPREGEFAIGESVRVGPFHNGEYSKVMKITGARYFCDHEFGPYSPSVIVRATSTKEVK